MEEINQSTLDEIRKITYEYFADECDMDTAEITDGTDIIADLEGDSLMLLSLLEIFRKKYNLTIELKALGKHLMKRPANTVGQVIDFARETADLPETFSESFVVDPGFHLLGSVDISRLLRSKRDAHIVKIMDPDRHQVLATADLEQVEKTAMRVESFGASSGADALDGFILAGRSLLARHASRPRQVEESLSEGDLSV